MGRGRLIPRYRRRLADFCFLEPAQLRPVPDYLPAPMDGSCLSGRPSRWAASGSEARGWARDKTVEHLQAPQAAGDHPDLPRIQPGPAGPTFLGAPTTWPTCRAGRAGAGRAPLISEVRKQKRRAKLWRTNGSWWCWRADCHSAISQCHAAPSVSPGPSFLGGPLPPLQRDG